MIMYRICIELFTTSWSLSGTYDNVACSFSILMITQRVHEILVSLPEIRNLNFTTRYLFKFVYLNFNTFL